MATRKGARSATDATRFTSTVPHATSKKHVPSPSGKGKLPSSGPRESPEERVRRLRAAHDAARNAKLSTVDKMLVGGRRVADVAHRVTVVGLMGLTVVAGVFTVYSVYDMFKYNRKRRSEFIEMQMKVEADSLAAARIAFINGTATEEQIALVDEATERARETGIKLPPLLGPPTPSSSSSSSSAAAEVIQQETDISKLASAAAIAAAKAKKAEQAEQKTGWWPFGGAKKETGSWSEGSAVKAVEDQAQSLRDQARVAFDKERENQRQGGMLDQVGLDKKAEVEKKGWW